MKNTPSNFNENSLTEIAAAEWLSRIDRGLSAKEQDELSEWLSEDKAHRKAIATYQSDWEDYDRLAGIHLKSHARIDPDLLAPGNLPFQQGTKWTGRIVFFSIIPFAAVLALVLFLAFDGREESSGLKVQPALELLARIEQRTLEDGSVIEINRRAEVEVAYTPSERRVYLKKGEANFDVAKDPQRPFIVNVAGIDVRAVGTVFSIRLSEEEVDVIVTEGIVSVNSSSSVVTENGSVAGAFLEIGQRGTVDLLADVISFEVTAIDEEEIEDVHLWQPRLLDYDSILLGEIVKEFNKSNPIQVVIEDPSLESISLSSTFWSDNVEGFVRLLESSFDVEAEWSGSREIVLRKKEGGA